MISIWAHKKRMSKMLFVSTERRFTYASGNNFNVIHVHLYNSSLMINMFNVIQGFHL